MDTHADDSAQLVELLDLRNAIDVGHSTGGGEVIRYVAKHANGRVAKAAIISAIPPVMVKKESNPGGTPIEVFDGFRAAMANRAQFYRDVPEGPFYGFNRPGSKVDQGALRLHQGLVRNRPYRGSEADHPAGAGDAQRG